jgi:hypothetical protein
MESAEAEGEEMTNERTNCHGESKITICKDCGRELMRGRHVAGTYQHADDCPRKAKRKTMRQVRAEMRAKFYGE